MAILEVTNVSKRFGGLMALSAVNLAVTENTVHAIIGPNGAGKSAALLSAKDPQAALYAHEAAGKASKLKALEQIPAALEKQLTDNLMLMSELGAQATPAIFYLDDNDRLQQHQGAPRPEALETILGPR